MAAGKVPLRRFILGTFSMSVGCPIYFNIQKGTRTDVTDPAVVLRADQTFFRFEPPWTLAQLIRFNKLLMAREGFIAEG